MTAQADRILLHLRKGKKLTQLSALREFNCFRLGARIWDLKRKGIAIKTKLVSDKKTGKHFAEYSLR